MLSNLSIKNVALIDELNLSFEKGLNILSGETGAGKSIIIDSLNFVLGGKADKTLIRHNTNFMSVEAVFNIDLQNKTYDIFRDYGIDEDTVIIYRTYNMDGKNEIRINGRASTVSMLKNISAKLADIYGQSEHISLMNKNTHITMLDNYGKSDIEKIKEKLKKICLQYRSYIKELKSFGGSEKERERLIDLYTFQINEIEQTAIFELEEEELRQRQNRYINMQKITEEITNSVSLISKGEYSLSGAIDSVLSSLNKVVKYDADLEGFNERLNSLKLELDDIDEGLNSYLYNLEYDPSDAEKTYLRLEVIKNLKRKYGSSVSEINEYKATTEKELERLLKSAENIEKLTILKEKSLREYYDLSIKLSGVRKQKAEIFEKEVLANLNDLSMKGTSFKVSFKDLPSIEQLGDTLNEDGLDDIEFMISPNAGEPLKSLSKIISGGEMSRFMLAIKNISSDIDHIDTLVFDEIDAGISGTTATAVGKKFASISKKHQIIAITHLPQIAAMADANYLITKNSHSGKTTTNIEKLSEEETINEVARLIGSADLSQHAALHAKEMIQWSKGYKMSLVYF